ncbi:hypothetical protein M8J77_014835 [Diaphorina citri]|nr:hypothetical protein M8J77_014835 [Diaphorina citri]
MKEERVKRNLLNFTIEKMKKKRKEERKKKKNKMKAKKKKKKKKKEEEEEKDGKKNNITNFGGFVNENILNFVNSFGTFARKRVKGNV